MSSKENDKTTNVDENSIKNDKPARRKITHRSTKTNGSRKRVARITNTDNRSKKSFAGRWHNVALLLVLYDLAVVNFSYISALWLRFDLKFSAINPSYLKAWAGFTPIYTVFCLIVFWRTRLYKSIWKYASYTELLYIIMASIITAVFHILFITLFFRRMPISYYIMGPTLQFIFMTMIRFSYRFVLLLRSGRRDARTYGRVMIIGAGNAGQAISRDIRRSREIKDRVMCFIDDEPNKWGRYIDGIPIVGGRDSILENVEKFQIQKIYLAIPSATAEQRRDILDICKETDCELKNLPGMYQFMSGEVTVSQMKKVSVEDLLGREPIKADMKEVFDFVNGKTVLVTGGGGSIGSELCRQIAAHSPRQLIILDIYENNAYDIQMELREKYPYLNLVTLIASVRDSRRMFGIFEKYRPQLVYHAAAHKHVPLMEDSPNEAIKNNAIGIPPTSWVPAKDCVR